MPKLRSNDLRRGLLLYRIDDTNERHVRATIFDQGANAGTLTLDADTALEVFGCRVQAGESYSIKSSPLRLNG